MGDIRVSAAASLGSLGQWIQTISGNLTGAQINGYKGTRLSFGDALVTSIRDGAGSNAALGGTNAIQIPAGSIAIGGTTTDFRQGAITQTGDDHHLAITGDAWFAVANPAGAITYTRNGEFHIDDGGNVVDAQGNFVLAVFDGSKDLVRQDGTSFVEPGPLPVLTAADSALGRVATGGVNLAGVVPVSRGDVLTQPVTAGTITTILGTGTAGVAATGAPVATATTNRPIGVSTDAAGNLYYTDGGSGAHRQVYMVPKADGTYFGIPMLADHVYPVAGNGSTTWSGEGLAPTATGLADISSVVVDPQGNMLLASDERVVFVPQQDGTYFGQTMQANRAYTLADSTMLPAGATVTTATFDPAGNVVFANIGAIIPVQIPTNVYMIPRTDGTYFGQTMTTGTPTVIAGLAAGNGYGPDGVPATASLIRNPHGLAVDAEGNVFFTDHWRVRMIPRQSGTYFGQAMQANDVYTVAGYSGALPPSDNEPATSTGVEVPTSLSIDAAGNLYFGGTNGSNVYMVPRTDGTYYGRSMQADWIYRIAGSDSAGYGGDGGPAASAQLNLSSSSGVWADGLGVWVTDTANSRIRYVPAFDSAGDSGNGLYTFLDQPSAGAQDRAVATRYVGAGPITVGIQRTGSDLPLMTLTTVDGTEVPITLTLTDVNNRPDNTAYDNARLIAEAINAKSNETGVAVSIVRDRQDPLGRVALVMGHVQRTLSETFIDFTDPVDPSADLLATGAGLLKTVTDAQGNTFHTVNVLTLTAASPTYRPLPGDRITFDATGQMINLSRGATASQAPPFATGVHIALATPANADGLEKTAGSSRFALTEAAGRVQVGFAGQEGTTAIDPRLGIQRTGTSTIGRENHLVPQALEASNTSITEQLPELTIAQKVFTSTTKLVSVGNALVDDLNGLIR